MDLVLVPLAALVTALPLAVGLVFLALCVQAVRSCWKELRSKQDTPGDGAKAFGNSVVLFFAANFAAGIGLVLASASGHVYMLLAELGYLGLGSAIAGSLLGAFMAYRWYPLFEGFFKSIESSSAGAVNS